MLFEVPSLTAQQAPFVAILILTNGQFFFGRVGRVVYGLAGPCREPPAAVGTKFLNAGCGHTDHCDQMME